MIAALLLGISYGFTAGISPGPLLGLVITQTLQKGWRTGNLVAPAPLCSDLPIIVLAVLIESRLPAVVFGWLGVIGGLFVIYLGVETIRTTWLASKQTQEIATSEKAEADTTYAVLWRATITNALNPHPYLFWGTVGTQVLLRSMQASGTGGAVAFLVGFYTLLVGAKLLLAFLVNRSRSWLQGRAYHSLLFISGILLLGLGVLLISEGIASIRTA